MASSPITAWHIEGEKVEVVTDFLFLGSKITVDSDFSYEIRRWLQESYDKPRQCVEKQTLLCQQRYIWSRLWFSQWSHTVVRAGLYRRESWTVQKAECQIIDVFELWCWRRLLKVPWAARRLNQAILREINPEYPLEGLMLKLKLQSFGHLMWTDDSLEKSINIYCLKIDYTVIYLMFQGRLWEL